MSAFLGVAGRGPNSFLSEHLATFVIGGGTPMTVEVGLKKLRQIEKTEGVWTLKVRMQIVPPDLIIIDESTGRVIEKFSMRSLKDIQSVNAGGVYNNLIVFSVMDCQIPELHIFRCIGRNASDFVSAVEFSKSGRISPGVHPIQTGGLYMPVTESLKDIRGLSEGEGKLTKFFNPPIFPPPDFPSPIADPTDRKVKLLDCLFSDIEAFVNQLQRAVEAFNNLKKRRTIRENGYGDGLVSMRCRLPPGKDFTDILQKFKLSFILIEKMKQRISNPNAPELIHFLFKPLSFVVKVIAGANFEKMELVSSVDNPLLTSEVKHMFENCLDTAENDLWKKLGKAWILTKDEWHESLPTYRPVFMDGWTPPLEWMREIFSETSPILKEPAIPKTLRTQEGFMKELQENHAKIVIAKENRVAANSKELTVNAGDVLELLDDSRNWWKVKNYKDESGFVVKRILQLT